MTVNNIRIINFKRRLIQLSWWLITLLRIGTLATETICALVLCHLVRLVIGAITKLAHLLVMFEIITSSELLFFISLGLLVNLCGLLLLLVLLLMDMLTSAIILWAECIHHELVVANLVVIPLTLLVPYTVLAIVPLFRNEVIVCKSECRGFEVTLGLSVGI